MSELLAIHSEQLVLAKVRSHCTKHEIPQSEIDDLIQQVKGKVNFSAGEFNLSLQNGAVLRGKCSLNGTYPKLDFLRIELN